MESAAAVGEWRGSGGPLASPDPVLVVEVVLRCCFEDAGGGILVAARGCTVVDDGEAIDPGGEDLSTAVRGSDAWELLPVSGYHGEDPRLAGVVLCCRLVGGVPTLFVCLTLECFPLVGTDARFLYTKDRVRFPNLKGSPEARATSDVDGNDCKSMGWAWIGALCLAQQVW